MIIKISHKDFLKVSRLASDKNEDYKQRHNCWIISQAILALAGKECNNKIKELVSA